MINYLQCLINCQRVSAFTTHEYFPTLQDLTKEYISYLLDVTCYNISETAKILNVSRSTLYNKIRRFNINNTL